ncbi:MAG TPA: TonB-dependent receptor, partial [Thermomicrobiales bacterium]|nr:TonB-dependent receptor [Thermomicrobiales bacterium]
ADPAYPRKYAQDKVFGKFTWRLAPNWQLVQSVHQEFLVNPDPPTAVAPFEATLRRSTSVPAITFGHLTHTGSANTVWDVRVGRFAFSQDSLPSTGDRSIASRFDNLTGITVGAPPSFSTLRIARTTAKGTVSHYQPDFIGADHEWKIGFEAEKGGHDSITIIPSGVRYIDRAGQPVQAVSSSPSHIGGEFTTAGLFATDAMTLGDRLTISIGLRVDHTRAVSPDLSAVDLEGNETGSTVSGLGTMYTWNLVSPRVGITAKLTTDGRTLLRGSYGRFHQGVLTGELEPFHPGASPITTAAFEPATGDYSRILQVVDNRVNLRFDRRMRTPRTDEYSVGIDRELGRVVSVAMAYVRKDGDNFIGWSDVGGDYHQETRTLADGRIVPVYALVSGPHSRQYLLTNPADYALTYNGLVMALAKRRSDGWQASGSYTLSRASGLQSSSGTSASGPQVSTVSPPQPLTFGRDPNDLTNARGRLPNDRPHTVRMMGTFDVPRTGLVLAANFQYFSGKPWAATALVPLPQNNSYRVLLEPRGTRRLSSQSLLNVRVSRVFRTNHWGRFELLIDVLNALNDTAEEEIATDYVFSPHLGQATRFVDPRRLMIGIRLNMGR